MFQPFDVFGVNFGRQLVGRFVGEVARIADGIGQSGTAFVTFLIQFVSGNKVDGFELRVFVRLFGGAVFVKAV